MVGQHLEIAQLMKIIEDGYREVPALNLTKPQMHRLWGLDALECDMVVDALEASRILRRTGGGTYVLDTSPTAAPPARRHADRRPI